MMIETPARTIRMLAAIALGCSVNAFAGQEMMSIEAPFRAKIAKEKIRAAAAERKAQSQEKSLNQSDCGSQSIGNVNAGPGPAPREVFVFAPNAINIVGRGGCR